MKTHPRLTPGYSKGHNSNFQQLNSEICCLCQIRLTCVLINECDRIWFIVLFKWLVFYVPGLEYKSFQIYIFIWADSYLCVPMHSMQTGDRRHTAMEVTKLKRILLGMFWFYPGSRPTVWCKLWLTLLFQHLFLVLLTSRIYSHKPILGDLLGHEQPGLYTCLEFRRVAKRVSFWVASFQRMPFW